MSLHDLLADALRGRRGATPRASTCASRPRPSGSTSTPGCCAGPLNVDLSGGEKKKNETLQLGVLRPAIAVLDELDSGLDVDALRACARRIEAATDEAGLGVLAITHYSRLLHELRADHVHVLAKGTIVRSRRPRAGRASSRRAATPAWSAPSWPARTRAPRSPSEPPTADPFADPSPMRRFFGSGHRLA